MFDCRKGRQIIDSSVGRSGQISSAGFIGSLGKQLVKGLESLGLCPSDDLLHHEFGDALCPSANPKEPSANMPQCGYLIANFDDRQVQIQRNHWHHGSLPIHETRKIERRCALVTVDDPYCRQCDEASAHNCDIG